MEYIFVDARIGQEKVQELKIPTQLTAGELMKMITAAFGINENQYKVVQVEPLGRILGEDEMLDEAGVGNGAQITLV